MIGWQGGKLAGMAHLPVNHPARPFYRVLVALIGLYLLGFGIAGYLETRDLPIFERGEFWVLGLQTNPVFSILSILAGLVVFGGAVYGRNVDHFINLTGGVGFLVAGLLMLSVLRTDANLLNFAVANCVVSFLIGLVLLTAGLYGKTGPAELAAAEDQLRHGEIGQPDAGPASTDSGR
jgi:hypothetical protein